jgi:ribosomal protein S27AE
MTEQIQPAAERTCPECGTTLSHEDSNEGRVGDAGHLGQVDYYVCPKGHGVFQFMHADRRLRPVST